MNPVPPRLRAALQFVSRRRESPVTRIQRAMSLMNDAEMTPETEDTRETPAKPTGTPERQPRPSRRGKSKQPRSAEAKLQQPRQEGQQPQQPQRAPRKVHPVLERLFELYPKMFGARFLPLKLGVYQELLAAHGEEFKAEDLKLALGLHARSTRYLEAVASGHKRHDLQGEPVEDLSPDHVHHAILEVFKRRQSRTQDDLRPQLRQRLVAAIEASGLNREDYMLAVRTQNPVANEALDEAFAEVGAKAAKREALRRAFEASGKSVEEFAEMYGMEVREVRHLLP